MSDHFGTLCIKWLISMSHKSIRQPSASQIVNRLSVLHKFIRQSQNVGLTLIQILIEVCRRFTMARSSENIQKHPSSGVLKKSCSENMHQIYRRTPMPKCYFNKVAMQLFLKSHFGMGICTFAACFQNTFS